MRLIVPLLVLAATAAASDAVGAPRTPILPGYWESTNQLLAPINDTSTETRCITPADVDKFMAGPSNHHYTCTYPTRIIADGKITLKGTCVSRKGREVAVDGHGTYTPTSFSLEANIATEFLGLPVSGRASTEAHRLADACPPPETPAAAAPPTAQ